MRSGVILFVAVCLLHAALAPLPGQQPTVYEAGSIIRIDAPGYTPGRIEAVVRGYTHEGLVIEDRETQYVYHVPHPNDIRYLAYYRGVDRRYSAKKWGLRGGFVLGAAGAIGGALLAVDRQEDDRILPWAGIGAAAGALTGALLGGALGAVFAKEEWQVYGLSPAWRDGVRHPVGVQFSIPTR